MTKTIKTLAIVCLATMAVSLASCTKDLEMTPEQREFTEMLQPGLVTNGAYILEYSASGFQLSSTSDGKYRVMTDDQSSYMEAVVKGDMKKTGSSVEASIKCYRNGELSQQELTMIVSKIEGDVFWLWNEDETTGVIVKKLI